MKSAKDGSLYQTIGDPIKNLAVAILSTAIKDFRKGKFKKDAECFIFEKNSKLFSMYCSWIGFSPDWVRNKILTKEGRRKKREGI